MSKNPIGRPTKYRPEYCEQVIEFMRAGFSLTAFAGSIGVARSSINAWMEDFPEFSEAVSQAKASRLVFWEEAAINIARGGGGAGAATITVFGLKNMAPDEYSERAQIDHTSSDGSLKPTVVQFMSPQVSGDEDSDD